MTTLDIAKTPTRDTAERSRLDQEIQFAKTEQLAVMTASMTLLGAVLGFGRLLSPLGPWEKGFGVVATVAVAAGGIGLVWALQTQLKATRLKIASANTAEGTRGYWVSFAYTLVLVCAAAMIVYAYLR